MRPDTDDRRAHGTLTGGHRRPGCSPCCTLLLLLLALLVPVPSYALDGKPTEAGEVRLLTDDYYHTLLDYIRHADHEIHLAMFLFKAGDSRNNRAWSIADELISARTRGVRVLVLLERSGYDKSINQENEKAAARLRQNGIDVFFDATDTTTHTKAVVIDRRYVFVGSHNLTHSALARNNELSLLVDNEALAGDIILYLQNLAAH